MVIKKIEITFDDLHNRVERIEKLSIEELIVLKCDIGRFINNSIAFTPKNMSLCDLHRVIKHILYIRMEGEFGIDYDKFVKKDKINRRA